MSVHTFITVFLWFSAVVIALAFAWSIYSLIQTMRMHPPKGTQGQGMSMTNERATDEPPAVTRLRELARAALPLEEIRNFEGQDADDVLWYIDRLTKGER